MSIRTFRRSATLGVALAAAAALTLSACGSSGGSSSSSSSSSPSATGAAITKDATLAALVPASVASTGLQIGSDASYPPIDFVDNGKITGLDIDLGNAIGQVLGVPVKFTNAQFDSIIPAIQSGKYNLGMSAFTANAARQKVVNFATYFNAGTQWATKAGNPSGIANDNACGKKVAVQKGTVQVADITARSAACKAAGKASIQIDQYQLQTDATGAVVSGKDDAMLADSPVTQYAVKTAPGLALLGAVYGAAPYGIAIPCGSAGSKSCVEPVTSQPTDNANYAKAIQGAVQKLIDGGQYTAILDKWGLTAGAVTTSVINPAK